LLTESGLDQFYQLQVHPGVRVKTRTAHALWSFLDEPKTQSKLLDFTDGKTNRVTFHIPAIHCVACVWLLENLFRILPGAGASQVNFPRREVSITFANDRLSLSRLVEFLVSIGYEPELNFGQLDRPRRKPNARKQWLQIGLAGFAFGNIMLFSLPGYLGLDAFSGPSFQVLFRYLSLVLSAPVLIYSASDYWLSAWRSIRQRRLTLDVPIAVGLAALYAQSLFEVVGNRGDGYADSLAGLVFFLLCGRAFQQKTHERIAFDRDFKSFFPLSVTRKVGVVQEIIGLSDLRVGDRLLLRNGELIPADSTLVEGSALIDYSFVTGEAEPVAKSPGDHLYAGGQQVGGVIEVQTVKAVSQSYLTSLWNHEAFRKPRVDHLNTLTNRYSRRFTRVVLAVACAAALFWALGGDGERGLKAFTSVLIVACPCALALAAPFGLGTAQRLLARTNVFLKNILVLERLAEVDTIVFDKTGTLTAPYSSEARFTPNPGANVTSPETPGLELSACERGWVRAVASHSAHPYSRRIAEALKDSPRHETSTASTFSEIPGRGIAGLVEGHCVRLGSRAWLEDSGVRLGSSLTSGSVCCVSIDGNYRGAFVLTNTLRVDVGTLVSELGRKYELALLSGDNEKERTRFAQFFGSNARLCFNQSPLDKLAFIEELRKRGKRVMMVGDGLNDAGALKQSDVGVAVVEKIGVFSPASDIILEASQVTRLFEILSLARASTRIVRASFMVSALYNLVGISIASAGILSPLICAVLMPLSSLTVVLFACGLTGWAAQRVGLGTSRVVQTRSSSGPLPQNNQPGLLAPEPALSAT
jgi:Cu+-exporting ATPase